MNRYLEVFIKKDLIDHKIVIVSGPRQTGKTTMAISFVLNPEHEYLNWDSETDRKIILKKGWPSLSDIIVLDEIHKYSRWKNFIKGIWDTNKAQKKLKAFIITGSARLDVFRKGGDSLLGRSFHYRLHPFCLSELKLLNPQINLSETLDQLFTYGGFPEPFLKKDLRFLNRWKQERLNKIINEDLRDLEKVQEVSQIKILLDLLRERAGSLISASNIASDLQVAPKTIQRWILILEKMFIGFLVLPYSEKLDRAISKAPKFYFYDNSDVIENDAKYENLVATHLLKEIQFRIDCYGEVWELRFLRDKEKREVDFVVLKDRKLHSLIEVKKKDCKISNSLIYYAKKLNAKECIQVVFELEKSFEVNGIKVETATDFLSRRLLF